MLSSSQPQPRRGKDVYELIKGGFLNAVSIGFDPDPEHMGPPTEKELTKRPEWAGVKQVYRKWKLLEVSLVPVPSNPEALVTAVGKGLQLSKTTMKTLGDCLKPVPTAVEIKRIPAKVSVGNKRAKAVVKDCLTRCPDQETNPRQSRDEIRTSCIDWVKAVHRRCTRCC